MKLVFLFANELKHRFRVFSEKIFIFCKESVGAWTGFWRENAFEFNLIFLLALIPFRLSRLFDLPDGDRLLFLMAILLLLFWERKRLVPAILDSFPFQGIFFLLLALDDQVCRSFFRSVIFSFCFTSCLVFCTPTADDFLFWVLFCVSLFSAYWKTKETFLSAPLEVVGADSPPDKDFGLESEDQLTWGFVVKAISPRISRLYQRSIENRLPTRLSGYGFPAASRRYMFAVNLLRRVSKTLAQNKEGVAVGGTIVGGVGTAVVVQQKRVLDEHNMEIEKRNMEHNKEIEKNKMEMEEKDRAHAQQISERQQAQAEQESRHVQQMEREKLALEKAKVQHQIEMEHRDMALREGQSNTGWFGFRPKKEVTVYTDAGQASAKLKEMQSVAPPASAAAKESVPVAAEKEKALSPLADGNPLSFLSDWFF